MRIQKVYDGTICISAPLPVVASAVGYDDCSYSIKVFKSAKDMTPSKAKRQQGRIPQLNRGERSYIIKTLSFFAFSQKKMRVKVAI